MKKQLLLLFLFTMYIVNGFSQIPLIYNVENSGSSYAAPTFPAISALPKIPYLPDPFEFFDGSGRSIAFADWARHRNDIRAMIENYEIGIKPAVDPSQVTASYSNTDSVLTVNVTVNGQILTLTCKLSIPPGATAPYPVCIGMNSFYGSLPASELTSRGIVGIRFSHNQVTTYNNAQNTDPFFKLYPDQNMDNTGQYAAWAWGVSRIIDGLYKVQSSFNADLDHIAVTGCSYAGKMALFSGAFDERIALTIPQESGGGGATSWRYSHTMPSGTVEKIDNTNYSWFKNSLQTDFQGDNVSFLPEDHHMLMAMCAPRALYCTGNKDMVWLAGLSTHVVSMTTAKIYSDLGIGDRFGFHISSGHGHCTFPDVSKPDLGYFLDRFIKGNTSLTQVIRTRPAEYDTVNYAKWYSEWGPDQPAAVEAVAVNPATLEITPSSTAQLAAVFTPVKPSNRKVTWSSSNTAVATVSATGLLTAVADGNATITVTSDDGAKTGTCQVRVGVVAASGVTINPSTVDVGVGAVSQLTATVAPVYASNKNVTWSTSDAAIATISATGLVTGVALGTATITATTVDGAKTAAASITVTPSSPVFINVGGTASGSFAADQYYTGGSTYTNTATIDIAQVAANIPANIFNTERYGAFTYTIPGRPIGKAQKITLYFAEAYVTAAGARVFNITVNDAAVLTNFDIFVEAGGQNKAIAKTFNANANANGEIVIKFTAVTENPKVCAIAVEDIQTTPPPTGVLTPSADTKESNVYPNPVTGLLYVKLSGKHSVVSLFDAGGKRLDNITTEDALISIDMSKYKSGVYFVKIVNAEGAVTEKVLKP